MKVRYVEMKEPIYETISARVRESFPKSCICWIEENENPVLLEAYENRKKEIMKRPSELNEVQFFHGTREENVTSIAQTGFDPTCNRLSAYGIGSYFAKDALYSQGYMIPNNEGISFMFLCNVLMGSISPTTRAKMIIDITKYDCAVNNLLNPTIVVTPHADGAYPRYIIAFHKKAK